MSDELSWLPRITTYCCVCGYDAQEPIWGEDGDSPTFIICSCCGAEFGYEDITLKSIKMHRQRWAESGYRWSEAKMKPENWDLKKQMENILEEFR